MPYLNSLNNKNKKRAEEEAKKLEASKDSTETSTKSEN